MAVAVAADGYRLWYEAEGDGPAVIFPARFRAEHAKLAAALAAGGRRVVRYKPRQVVGAMEPEDEAGGDWDAASCTEYPLGLEIADLHAVADAAGAGDFVLAGYSGMAALAAFHAAASERAVGLLAGGFPIMSDHAYWLGYTEGAKTAFQQAGAEDKANELHLSVLLYRAWSERDDTGALTALKGPKAVWYGTRDGEPDCRMYGVVGGSAIARRIAGSEPELRRAGFEVIAFDGFDHIAGLATTDAVAPRLSAVLSAAGW